MNTRLHNLLTGDRKRTIRHEYLARVGTVGALFVGIACICALVALLPTYMGVRNERGYVQDDIERRSSGVDDRAQLEKRIKDIANLATLITPYAKEGTTVSRVEAVLGERPPSVRIRGITHDSASNVVTVEGIAETRSEYLRYEAALKKREGISRVERPASIFEGGTDIAFRMQVFFFE